MNQESTGVNYSLALKNYNQNGRGRSMRKFCEDEGYESGSSGALGIAEVRVRFTNGMELIQSDGDVNELFSIVRKMLV